MARRLSHVLFVIRRPKTACLPAGALIETTLTGERLARWTTNDGKHKTAPMSGKRIIVAPGEWSAQFLNAHGKRTTVALHTGDKRVAEQKAAKLASEAHNIR